MSKQRKVVLFLVEGITDQTALALPLRKFYGSDPSVEFRMTQGDMTTQSGASLKNIVGKVGNEIKRYATQQKLEKQNFLKIVHVIDTDGAFVPDGYVKADDTHKEPFYKEDGIYTASVEAIQRRNHQKTQLVGKLLETHRIWGCPYQMYYMSCNLEHALYGEANADNERKNQLSRTFEKKYKDQPDEFLKKFQSIYPCGIEETYESSWAYIQNENHSLQSGSNLYLVLKDERKRT